MSKPSEQTRRFAPAAQRNTEPILGVLREVLPASGIALEIGSGSGQHAVAFAEAFPGLDWQPSDAEAQARASIAVRVADAGLDNLAEPLDLDVTAPDWDAALDGPCDAIVCINVLHITPWAVAEGLMRGAGRLLAPGGIVYLYGPYKRDGQHTAPSNAAFDASLRHRTPPGASATSPTSRPAPRPTAWPSTASSTCPATTSRSCSDAVSV